MPKWECMRIPASLGNDLYPNALDYPNVWIAVRVNANGDPECASDHGVTCHTGKTTCDTSRPFSVACGVQFLTLHGSTGYDDPDHWCAIMKAKQMTLNVPPQTSPLTSVPAKVARASMVPLLTFPVLPTINTEAQSRNERTSLQGTFSSKSYLQQSYLNDASRLIGSQGCFACGITRCYRA
jgi:hypothetical protein